MPSFFPEGNTPVASETQARTLVKILGALVGDGSPSAQVQGVDGGPGWTAQKTVISSSDLSAAKADLTSAPESGNIIVITDLIVSADTAMTLTFTEEGGSTEFMAPIYIPADSVVQLTTRGWIILGSSDLKAQVISDTAGNVGITCLYTQTPNAVSPFVPTGSTQYVVDTFADMQALDEPTSTVSVVFTRGLTTVGDGGGGIYLWSPSSTAADDGITVCKLTATSGAGRYIRM